MSEAAGASCPIPSAYSSGFGGRGIRSLEKSFVVAALHGISHETGRLKWPPPATYGHAAFEFGHN